MEVQLPEHIPAMLNAVPEENRPKGEEEAKFWRSLAYELAEMIKAAAQAKQPQIVLNTMRQAGTQYIWEFYVNDTEKPRTNAMNWHGQFCSQWCYAGCIMVSNGRVSIHH